jgi:hypothetical protein
MMVWNLIFWLPLDWGKGTAPQRLLHLVFSVSVLLGLTGGRLERRLGR